MARSDDPGAYGRAFAAVYDRWYRNQPVEPIIMAMTGIDGPILELGVGTGRLAIPLAESGHEVWGVDSSPEMLSVLASKPGADRITVLEQDMADLDLEAEAFGAALAAFNVLFNLPDVDAKRRCANAVAAGLRPNGKFVIDAAAPRSDGPTSNVGPASVAAAEPILTVSTHDPDEHIIRGQHVAVVDGDVELRPWLLHYMTPEELDALLTECGFTLEQRWADWESTPWTPEAPRHVSWYRMSAS